jgi:hypothetical protein
MLQKLEKMDRRIIYLVVFLSLAIPLIWPIGLPISVGPETASLYKFIDSLPARTPVVISFDTSPGGYGELSSGAIALLNHLAKKDLRCIGMGFFDTGPSLMQSALANSLYKGKTYGTDYVNLGYVSGGENAISAVAKDIIAKFPKDFTGKSTSGIPVMQGITTMKDVSLIVTVSSGTPGVAEWIRQVGDPMKVPMATVLVAVNIPNMTPYLNAKQLYGMIPSMKGAAGYEALIGMKALGTSGMDAQSISHLAILFFVILGNVISYASRNKPGSAKGGGRQ